MKIITLLNEKGGVGKTTLATHIAGGLANRGKRVVIIDADPQGDATETLGFAPKWIFYDLMVRNMNWGEALAAVPEKVYRVSGCDGELFLVPGNSETQYVAAQLQNDKGRIREKVSELESAGVDYVVFDASPTPSDLHNLLISASTNIIMPTQLAPASALRGVAHTNKKAEEIQQDAESFGLTVAEVTAIVPTQAKLRTSIQEQILQVLIDQYGDKVWQPQRNSILYDYASLAQKLVFAYDPNHDAVEDVWAIIDRVEAL